MFIKSWILYFKFLYLKYETKFIYNKIFSFSSVQLKELNKLIENEISRRQNLLDFTKEYISGASHNLCNSRKIGE